MQTHIQPSAHLSAALIVIGLMQPISAAAEVKLEDTRNGSQLKVEADSEQAKQFLATGKNPYIGEKTRLRRARSFISSIPVRNVTALKPRGKRRKV